MKVRRRCRSSGRATRTRPTKRDVSDDPDGRDGRRGRARGDDADGEDERGEQRQERRPGGCPVLRPARPAAAYESGRRRRAVQGVGRQLDVAGRDVRPGGLHRRQDDADGDDRQDDDGAEGQDVAEGDGQDGRQRRPRSRRSGPRSRPCRRSARDRPSTARPSSTRRRRAAGTGRPARPWPGPPVARAMGRPTTVPMIMIQASTTREPIIRLERDEARVAAAHRMAAPRPPTIAITAGSVTARAVACPDGQGRVASGGGASQGGRRR